MALREPQTLAELRDAAALPAPVVRRHGEELLELLTAQREVPEAELPPTLPAPLDAAQREQVKKLKAQVRDIAGQLAVAPEVLVPGKDYELLLREASGEDIETPVHWLGWRKEAVLAQLRHSLREGTRMSLLCQVYRSSRKQEMYLYVDKARGLLDVPDTLLAQFGDPAPVMLLHLTPQRKLARADAALVLASIQTQGFYLQMPPTVGELLVRDSARG